GRNISDVAARRLELLAAVNNRTFGADPRATNPNPPSGGLYRSTDGGTNFQLVRYPAGAGTYFGNVTDVAEDPNDPRRIYIAVLPDDSGTLNGGFYQGIFRSNDFGQTWMPVTDSA